MKNIVIKNIDKSFGEKHVLKNFSAEFPSGSCTCIMGPSGCGKTTLLKILLGLEKADAGTVEGMPERVSVVFQENRLCEDISVRSNLKMVTEKDAGEILAELGLGSESDTKVSELSGGMQRRIAIARALLFDSELIIMDEPFKGLDAENRALVAAVIRRTGRTVVFVSHHPEEAEIMNAGRIIHIEK